MNRFKFRTATLSSLLIFTLSACDSIPFINNTPDYKNAGRSRPLEVPPDLTSVSANDTYAVPGGSTSYSAYSQGQAEPAQVQEKILANPDNVRLERAGSQRWLVVQAPPEKIWPVIREFWTELGFAVRVENPQTGVMETEWVDVSKLTKDSSGNYLSKFQGWLDKLNTIKDRQKFRTRIDRGTDDTTTEIYMSHRSMSDVPDDGKTRVRTVLGTIETGYAPEKKRSQTEVERGNSEDLDAELLRRLMVRLGVEEQKSKTVLASSNGELRANIGNDADGTLHLVLNDPFDRAWRRVGLALDRVGFVVEDKDRSKGLFYVRYADVDIDEAPQGKKGFLSSLKFWGNDEEEKNTQNKPKPIETKKPAKSLSDKLKFWRADDKEQVNLDRQYHVKVETSDKTGSLVTITDKQGNRDHSSTANKIIKLLFEQLK